MVEKRLTPIEDKSVWNAADLAADRSWLQPLTEEHKRELRAALEGVRARRLSVPGFGKDDFPLPGFGRKLASVQAELEDGRGVVVLRDMPIGDLALEDIEALYWGLGAHLGEAIVQDARGTWIHHICDLGAQYSNVRIRGYKTNAALSPHCDTADVAALLCVRPAKSGGTNTLASAMAIYNEVLAHHPEYIDPLCRGFHYNIRGEGPKGPFRDITQHRVPVYSYHAGRLSVRFNWKAIKTAEQVPGGPSLTELEHAALDYVADLSHREDLGFAIGLEAGDLLLLNNYTVLHMRDSFEDHEDPAKRRLLLRLWVNMPNSRPLLPDFADHYNTGPRQGPFVHHHEGDPDFETA